MKDFKSLVPYYLLIAAVIFIDRGTKLIIAGFLPLESSINVLGEFFQITYIRNSGAAFGILQGRQIFLITLTFAVMLAIFAWLTISVIRREDQKFMPACMALVVGGGIGNLIDRSLYGYVIDFFDFSFWPVFNVADIALVVGCIFFAVYYCFIYHPPIDEDEQEALEAEYEEHDIKKHAAK